MCVPVESEQADEKTMGLAIWRGFFLFRGLRRFCRLNNLLFFGQVEGSFASGAVDFFGFVVRGDFQLQAADTCQEKKLVEPEHDVADLPHLGLTALFLFGFSASFA